MSSAVAHPTYKKRPQTTYSCVNSSAYQNCHYDVHVLSAQGGDYTAVLDIDLNLTVSGETEFEGNVSVVLVLLSQYARKWILDIPSGLTIEKVILVSSL